MSAAHFSDRDQNRPVGNPFTSNTMPVVRVLIRRLPRHMSEESLRAMVVWAKDLNDVELLPIDRSEDDGFRSALLRFRSIHGAMQVKNVLDGKANTSNDADMIVEILANSPPAARRSVGEQSVASSAGPSSMGSHAAPAPRQYGHYAGFQGLDHSAASNYGGMFPGNDYVYSGGVNTNYQNIFSPQSPIGNHLAERPRISGKALIGRDYGDDEETNDLLKDPVAYAENGGTWQRRPTVPQIPVSRMTNLSLSRSHPQGTSSLPPYMSPMSPAPSHGFSTNGHNHQGRKTLPPVNPADQNPPCNTLYVGNLPIDTSEEELKAIFSKQRGYKRLCFRTKQNGPMCFVEFEDISFATKALHDLHGRTLHNSMKSGIRLSFSKNPLGVRSGQAPGQAANNFMGHMNGMMAGGSHGFYAHGPPPGLSAPPGLGSRRGNHNPAASTHTGGAQPYNGMIASPTGQTQHYPWNNPSLYNGAANVPTGPLHNNSSFFVT
ncbi:hypothetical protein E4U38_001285 [Claviceps purpurea]|nr:hypothetical protein E4U38_001285 [Claviceps purpurea]KAG6238159.1 hypothetical protein E4U25_001971 [Claviceps purpurea]